jgi:hypothetical protein
MEENTHTETEKLLIVMAVRIRTVEGNLRIAMEEKANTMEMMKEALLLD